MTNRAASSAAATLLAKHSIRKQPVNVEAMARKEGLDVVFHDMEDKVSGLLITNAQKSVIVVNVRHHPKRQRFTIAHELGHFMLHRSKPAVFVDNHLVHFRSESETTDRREVEANAFAANLLMPAKMVEKDFLSGGGDLLDEDTLRNVAERFEVSVQALAIRVNQLGLASL